MTTKRRVVRIPWGVVLVLVLAPAAAALHGEPSAEDEVEVLDSNSSVTWYDVEFHPSGDYALIVGSAEDQGDGPSSVVARWDEEGGVQAVYKEPGPPVVSVDIHSNGTSLAVGTRDLILMGEPESMRNVWNESQFGGASEHSFFGYDGAFSSNRDFGIVSGSSLLRVEPNGSLEVIHGGQGAFFGALGFNPKGQYALVDAALDQTDEMILGSVWRTNGYDELSSEDNVALYGRFNASSAWLNSISFAPNGTYATMAGSDGEGASFLTWAAGREGCPDEAKPCPSSWFAYMGSEKARGDVRCIDWHPTRPYALVVGVREDVIGFAGPRIWAPLAHEGPDLFGCAFSPGGERALAVGEEGSVLEIVPGTGPLVRVVNPQPHRLVPPFEEQRFTVGVVDRLGTGEVNVSVEAQGEAWVEGRPPVVSAFVNASSFSEGENRLWTNATSEGGNASVGFPFVVNNHEFQPGTPMVLEPEGLEGENMTTDRAVTVHWESVDEQVVFQVEVRHFSEGSETVQRYDVGRVDRWTARLEEDGTYQFRVRAMNAFTQGNWSDPVVVTANLEDAPGTPGSLQRLPHGGDESLPEREPPCSGNASAACVTGIESLLSVIEEHRGIVEEGMEVVYSAGERGVGESAERLERVQARLVATVSSVEHRVQTSELSDLVDGYISVGESHVRGFELVWECWKSGEQDRCREGLSVLETANGRLDGIEEEARVGLEGQDERDPSDPGSERHVDLPVGGVVLGVLLALVGKRWPR